MILQKSFTIKIYSPTGEYLTTLKPDLVKNVPSFRSQINGGYGECRIDLNLPFESFSEGENVSHMNIVKIYVSDGNHTKGRLVYTGFISNYEPFIESKTEGITIVCLGLVSLLSLNFYMNGSSFTVTQTSKDPTFMMKAIIDHFNAVYSGSLLGYTSENVEDVGVSVSLTFTEKKWLDALQDAFNLNGGGRWWTVDQYGQLYMKQKPASATHIFTVGKDVEEFRVNKSSESIVNSVLVKYNGGQTTYSDSASISLYGKRTKIINDTNIPNLTAATQRAMKEVNDNKDNKIKTSLIINSLYDIESIQVGDTCRVLNIGKNSNTFSDNMQIVSVAYTMEKVTLELEQINNSFGLQLQRFITS